MAEVALTNRVVGVEFTIPAQTAIAAPATLAVNLGSTQLTDLRIIIPKGHVGLVGLQVRYGGAQLIPWDNVSTWLRGDGEDYTYPLNTQITSNLTLRGYNLGRLPHTFLLRFIVDDKLFLRRPSATMIVPV